MGLTVAKAICCIPIADHLFRSTRNSKVKRNIAEIYVDAEFKQKSLYTRPEKLGNPDIRIVDIYILNQLGNG